MTTPTNTLMSYTLGGGCFWCLDAVYRQLSGVVDVKSGYSGGRDTRPNYYSVCSGASGHHEVIQVTFDCSVIPKEVILDIFFLIHDPTTWDRQAADAGSQYRSVMLYSNQSQKQDFIDSIARAQANWDNKIITEVKALDKFYIAEDEHQDYFNKQPASGYCSVVVYPKIIKARQAYSQWFRSVQ